MCRRLHDTATLMSGKQKLVVILLTKMGPTHCPETSLTNQPTPCYNQEGTDPIPNHSPVSFMLFKLLSHQTCYIHMVYGQRDFYACTTGNTYPFKAVLSFRVFDFRTTRNFIHYKFSPLIRLLYIEFGLLYAAHKWTLWPIAQQLCKTECQTVLCVYQMPKKVCEISTIQGKNNFRKFIGIVSIF